MKNKTEYPTGYFKIIFFIKIIIVTLLIIFGRSFLVLSVRFNTESTVMICGGLLSAAITPAHNEGTLLKESSFWEIILSPYQASLCEHRNFTSLIVGALLVLWLAICYAEWFYRFHRGIFEVKGKEKWWHGLLFMSGLFGIIVLVVIIINFFISNYSFY